MDIQSTCELAATLADRLEGLGKVEVRQVLMLVEVDYGGGSLSVFKASSDDREWVQEAFLNHSIDVLFYDGEPVAEEDEEDWAG